METNFYKIDPMYDKKKFLRKAWIALSHEDVPLEVFDANFSDVTQNNYHIFCTGADYEVSWNAEIGDYRTESYVDFETYRDEEPYTEYEKKYNSSTNTYTTEPVTKYRTVEKQKQVTKTRTVTDWHSGTGELKGTAKSWECIDPNDTFDENLYEKDVKSEYVIAFTEEELAKASDMRITAEMLARAQLERDEELESDLRSSLPGDVHRSVSYRTLSYTQTYASLFRVPEYSAKIVYRGNTYVKRAFACGDMEVGGDPIDNPLSADKVNSEKINDANKHIEKRNQETKELNQKRVDEIDGKVWNKTKFLSLLSLSLLLTSIAISALLKFLFPVITVFAISIGTMIFSKSFLKKATEAIEKETEEKNAACSQKCDAECKTYKRKVEKECANYEKTRRSAVLAALNAKLASLGMPPASATEYSI